MRRYGRSIRAHAASLAAAIEGDRGAALWVLVVSIVYVGVTAFFIHRAHGLEPDRMMQLAINMTHGRFDVGPLTRFNDIVTIDGRNYEATGLLPAVPYLVFVPLQPLWGAAAFIVSGIAGMVTGWLALPLARRYGPPGAPAYWLAALAAFGTLVLTQATDGNFYYLAQVEAVLFTFAALIEWGGRRRAWVVGAMLGLASLARPTLLLAAVPLGLALLLEARDRFRAAVALGVPIGAALVLAGLFNLARFGSAFETGYGISQVSAPLAARRAEGLFSLRFLPENAGLLVAQGFDVRARFPYLVPPDRGHSLLLTSPALLGAINAGVRGRLPATLWAAAFLVAVPVLLYYGYGGPSTYGYRYALDFMPFLFALTAIAARRHFGGLEKLLIVLSVAFVSYGFVWRLYG